MSTMPPPLDPNDPRAGDPINPGTWFVIIGVIIGVIVVGSITLWNRGGDGKPIVVPPVTASAGPTTSEASTPTGGYKIIFDGVGDGSVKVPNNCQTFRSRTTHAEWHLVYTYGDGASSAPDLSSSNVTGAGDSEIWTENPCLTGDAAKLPVSGAACHVSSVKYTPNVSLLKRVGGDTFSLTAPLAGDLSSACANSRNPEKPTTDPFYEAWSAVCPPPAPEGAPTTTDPASFDDCALLGPFESAEFTIKAGQTGTVVTQIPRKTFHHLNNERVYTTYGTDSNHSWSGTITVIAQ